MNVTGNITTSVYSVQGDYTTSLSELTLKLIIADSNVKHMPNKISHFFPNLHFLGVVRSNLEVLRRENFDGLEMVKTLDLRRNKISKLSDDTFHELINLRKIDLSRNSIKFLPSGAFMPMYYLTKFIANDNQVELFDSDIFQYNKKLQEVHLWQNRIKAIRFDSKKFSRLSVFDLRKNVCVDALFYLSSEYPASQVQKDIVLKCSSYVRQKGQIYFRASRAKSVE